MKHFISSHLPCAPVLPANAVRTLVIGLGLLCGGTGLGACAATRPMAESEINAAPAVRAARAHLTLAAVGVPVADASGRSRSLGAVRPVTCIRLPGGDLLTAAHTLPDDRLGKSRMYTDPATGLLRVDEPEPSDPVPLVMIVDGTISRADVSASDTLRYASAGMGTRASVPADWAVLTPDRTGATKRFGRAARASVHAEVQRVGTPVRGETCYMIGYPQALMDDGLFESGPGVSRPEHLRWLEAQAVVIEGVIESIGRDRIEISTEGLLGAKGRGLSGGGVFVEREGAAVLIGIAVQASKMNAIVTACPLPDEVTRRFGRDYSAVPMQADE